VEGARLSFSQMRFIRRISQRLESNDEDKPLLSLAHRSNAVARREQVDYENAAARLLGAAAALRR
jgi:hypothetical protein